MTATDLEVAGLIVLRHFYTGTAWAETRKRILERADHYCEQCGCPRNVPILRRKWKERSLEHPRGIPRMAWRRIDMIIPRWWDEHGELVLPRNVPPRLRGFEKSITDPLTIAHLNHVAGDDRDENLRCLCTWCHLHHDQEHHKETRCARKDPAGPMLEVNNAGSES
jgi:hypothetical protein